MRMSIDKTGQKKAAGKIENGGAGILLDRIGRYLLDLALTDNHCRFLYHLETPARRPHHNRVLQDRWTAGDRPVTVFPDRIKAQPRRRSLAGFFSRHPAHRISHPLDYDRDNPASNIKWRAIEQNQVRVFPLLDGAKLLFQAQAFGRLHGDRLERHGRIESSPYRGAGLEAKVPRTDPGGGSGADSQWDSSFRKGTRKALTLRAAAQVQGSVENRSNRHGHTGCGQLRGGRQRPAGAQEGQLKLKLFPQAQGIANIIGAMSLDKNGEFTLQGPTESLESHVELWHLGSLGAL